MIKVADINISEDNCGLYTVKLLGSDAQFFNIIGKSLYFILSQPYICKNLYTVTISVEDLAGRFAPKTATYTLNANNCSCTSTSTTTTSTAQSTTTTTTSTPSTCLVRFAINITNLTNNGAYYTGLVTGAISGGNVWGTNDYGYTDDSDFAMAAVHAGLLQAGQTAILKFTILGTKSNFPSSTANGITTSTWSGNWCAVQISSI